MKYIVFWIAVSVFPAPCPTPTVTIDEYGFNVGRLSSMTLQACWDKTETKMQKEFDSIEAAQEFVDKGKKEYTKDETLFLTNYIKDWEIKELKPIGGLK
jgi:hypothetical protein